MRPGWGWALAYALAVWIFGPRPKPHPPVCCWGRSSCVLFDDDADADDADALPCRTCGRR